jgi:hypothetical protein
MPAPAPSPRRHQAPGRATPDLQRNRLTQRGIAALEALGLPVPRVEYQRQAGEAEDQYLYDGDWE